MTKDEWSFDEMAAELLQNADARAAYNENDARRALAVEFDNARKARGLSVPDLAEQLDTTEAEVRRLLHLEQGGALSRRTIFRAAEAFDLTVNITVGPTPKEER